MSPEETFALGKSLAPLLQKGSIVALKGPLGAGKTCFAKGVACALGVTEDITSPTYTIVSEYEAFLPQGAHLPLYHIDAYRLRGSDDFSAIGGEEIIFAEGISLIEWSERIEDFIPPQALRVDIEITEGERRLIRVYTKGDR
ncbi:MAG: tRNA (adenosine(37)-N6)-threonylcarbamoyltransferase complex ATPase subunit type 1 TsaE [Treponema sp.]|nr:tRNA (adenosine(37)-N6)-threonylcarbamoyltransferase complex ATPase subunit type 1 TsaE [Treponema sp.]